MPGDLSIWVAQESGTGRLSLEWPVKDGSWTVVVMNSDGSADVAASVDMGAPAPVLNVVGICLLIAGGVLLLSGALLNTLSYKVSTARGQDQAQMALPTCAPSRDRPDPNAITDRPPTQARDQGASVAQSPQTCRSALVVPTGLSGLF